MKTVARVHSFVDAICTKAKFRPSVSSVVSLILGGITASGSVVLSELLRPQVDKPELHGAEQRVSSALRREESLDALPDAYLAVVGEHARKLRFRSVDGSDLSKPAGRHFEHLDVVRDGSCKPRDRVAVTDAGVVPAKSVPYEPRTTTRPKSHAAPRPKKARTTRRTAERRSERAETKTRAKFPSKPALKKLGYWMIQIEAGNGEGAHLPLSQDVFSTQDPAYQALGDNAWFKTYCAAIERMLAHVTGSGIWLLDRGFDDVAWMNWTHIKFDQTVLRLKRDRRVRAGTSASPATTVGDLARALATPHTTRVRHVDKSTHKTKYRPVQFAWLPIAVDGVDHPLYLIVAHTGGKNPMLLVTDKRPENADEAAAIIAAYFERWGNEETTRAQKQLTGLERIRVRSFQAIRRLTWLAMIAVGIQALIVLTCGRLTRAILDRAKEFIADVRYVAYRVWRVVQQDMLDSFKTPRRQLE